MASKNVKVSQNFSENSGVSLSRFLSSSGRLAVSNFLQSRFGVKISVSQFKDLKESRSRRGKRWSRRLAKARIYHSPPFNVVPKVKWSHAIWRLARNYARQLKENDNKRLK